jgi:hypothetical protein
MGKVVLVLILVAVVIWLFWFSFIREQDWGDY